MMHKSIEYRTISRFPGYRFGSDGTAWSAYRGAKIGNVWKRLNPVWSGTVKQDGKYLRLSLSLGGKGTESIALHIAIAEAFFGPKPDHRLDCCHNDGNKANCAISNLRYDTRRGNSADKLKHGTLYCGERHHSAKLTIDQVRDIRAAHGTASLAEIGSRFGISARTVLSIARRKIWKTV